MPTVEANGVDLYYERRGDGPPVIFLHGMGMDHRLWPEFTEPLTDDYEIVVLDMRFHGRSGGDPDEDVTLDTYVDDIRALVEILDLDTPTIIGHSMGGMVALQYADSHPEDVRAVVTIGAQSPDTPTARTWLYTNVVYPLNSWLHDTFGEQAAERFVLALFWLTRENEALSDLEEIERIITDHHVDYPEPTQAEHTAIDASLEDYSDRTLDYGAIDVPFLALHGELEPAIMAHHADHLAANIPRCRAVRIPEAGHVSMVENLDFVRDTICDFLKEHLAQPQQAESV